jgi:hypothetical protein
VLATEPSFLVLKSEPVFEDSGEAGEPHGEAAPRFLAWRLDAEFGREVATLTRLAELVVHPWPDRALHKGRGDDHEV